MIECGADVNTKDEYRQIALLLAAGGGHFDVVRCLVHGRQK